MCVVEILAQARKTNLAYGREKKIKLVFDWKSSCDGYFKCGKLSECYRKLYFSHETVTNIILDVVPPISMHFQRYDDCVCVDKKCAFGLNSNSLVVWNIFSIPQLALVTTACLSRSSKDHHIKQKKKNTKRNQRKLQSQFIAHGKYCTNSLAED